MRPATASDLDAVKAIADSRRSALGFVLRPTLAESISRDELLVAEESGEIVGFVEYHLRRDSQISLYHIAVSLAVERQGVGQALLNSLCKWSGEAGAKKIALKCPMDLAANRFYEAYGFELVDTVNGRKRPLNCWVLML